MKNLKFIGIALMTLLLAFGVTSCKKGSNTGHLNVKMMDDPGDFDTVSVEVLEVQIHYSNEEDDESGWTTLATEAGNYDLLLLQDGVTATLTEDAEIPVGNLQQMRLILGSNNYVIVDEEMFPLELSSQDKTGLKMNLNTTIMEDDSVEVVFDFDVEKSINITGSGAYKLKPVLKVEEVIIF